MRSSDGDGRIARVMVLVAAVAAAVRLGPAVLLGELDKAVGYDEAVYFWATQLVQAGVWPYADFQFVHPPGIIVVLTPFAWLAGLTSDPVAVASARVFFAAAGAGSAALVVWLLREYGRWPAAAGGLLYAVWSAAALGESAVVMMEPWVSLGLLVALAALDSGRRTAPLVAGLALGTAIAVKLWVAVPIVVLCLLVVTGWRWRGLALYALGGFSAFAAIVLPFALRDPGGFWANVVGFQSGRPRDVGLAERVASFGGHLVPVDLVPAAAWLGLGLAGATLVAAPLATSLRRQIPPGQWSMPVWWSLLALLQFATLAVVPSFYDNYTSFSAPALCLLAGYGLSRLLSVFSGRAVGAALTLVAVSLTVLSLGSVRAITVMKEKARPAELGALVAGYDCVWAADPSALIEAGVSGAQAERRCPMFVDRFAVAVSETGATDAAIPAALPSAARYQAAVADQLRSSDAALLLDWQLQTFAPSTTAVLEEEFDHVATVGEYRVWDRK